MSVKVSAEKNFRRARVKPAKKRTAAVRRVSWRLGAALAVCLLSVYAVYRATNLVLNASALQVRSVRVHGNVRLSSGEVQALVEGLLGTNILAANLESYRHRLLVSSDWVADVAIRRVLPSTVDVFVAERTPIGITRIGVGLYLVDRTGVLMDEFGPRYAEFDFPVIDGVAQPVRGSEPTVDPVRTELAARFLDEVVAADPDLARQVSQVDVNDPRNVIVMLDSDTTLLHVGTDKFAERLQAYIDLAPTLRASVPEIDYVELRFAPRIYVQPVRGTRVVAARPLSAGN
jgi:cell division septal protein FtsQ